MKEKKNRFGHKLWRLYGKQPSQRDVFGRRKATAKEIEASIKGGFKQLEPHYLPTRKDIEDKTT